MAAPRPSGNAAILRFLGILGAILVPIFLLLAQIKSGDESLKGWADYKRIDIFVLLLCIGALAALGASFVSVKPGLPAVAGALLFGAFGLVIGLPFETAGQEEEVSIGIGAWLAALAALVGTIGAVGAASLPEQGSVGPSIGAGRGASALHRQPSAPVGAPQQVQTGGTAPGWYPDPNGQARLRYYDGINWTDQTHN